MAGNSLSFSAGFASAMKKAGDRVDALIRQASQELAERVVMRTPVDTGFARASWWAMLNGAGAPANGTGSLSSISLELSKAKAGDVIQIANNCAYILRLEYGHSKQAPYGMVRQTLKQWPHIVKETLASLKVGQ